MAKAFKCDACGELYANYHYSQAGIAELNKQYAAVAQIELSLDLRFRGDTANQADVCKACLKILLTKQLELL